MAESREDLRVVRERYEQWKETSERATSRDSDTSISQR